MKKPCRLIELTGSETSKRKTEHITETEITLDFCYIFYEIKKCTLC